MNITQKYLINGPNNVIRLINDDKVIYIFGDFHHNINEQFECPFNEKHKSFILLFSDKIFNLIS